MIQWILFKQFIKISLPFHECEISLSCRVERHTYIIQFLTEISKLHRTVWQLFKYYLNNYAVKKRFSAEKFCTYYHLLLRCNCDYSGLKRNIYEKRRVNMSCLAQTVWGLAHYVIDKTVNARSQGGWLLSIVLWSATKIHITSMPWPFVCVCSYLHLVTDFQLGSTYRVFQKCVFVMFHAQPFIERVGWFVDIWDLNETFYCG